jgi:hypothetical protein
MNKKTIEVQTCALRLRSRQCDGSVMLVAIITVLILLLMIGATLLRTTNKYFTAYQWASWQEALQGAESGADIAMAEMRKDISTSSTPWVGWSVGKYKTVNGVQTKDTSSYKAIGSDGNFLDNSGGGNGNATLFNINYLTTNSNSWNFVTYSTQLTPHAGEGNTNLRITVTVDSPSSLIDNANRHWLRVRATGTTDLAGPARVSEEQLDNRLRKLGLFWDKILAATNGSSAVGHQTTRQIELVAKPVTMFAGALTAMVQIKSDGQGVWTDSFNSEDRTNWPVDGSGNINLAVSHDPTNALGKNGDVASNAFPVKHDHSENLDLTTDIIYGDVGNNYSQIKKLDPAYYTNTYDAVNNPYGLNNGSFTNTNPLPGLIKTDGGADVSGAISTNYYRDLPAVPEPTWTSSNSPSDYRTLPKVDKGTADLDNMSTDPNNPTHVQIGTTSTPAGITLAAADKWMLKSAPKPKGWTASTPTIHRYVEIWVTGNIKLDDGGTIVLQQQVDGPTGVVISDVAAKIYVDHDIKVGETKETKTNSGGFDVQSDDAKDLLILGVTQADANKLPHDEYVDPLGNDAVYTPYKASGNIVFTENDFTGAIYAPDHNIVFNNSADGRGKRHKRIQTGADFYGSYVGRTINNKKGINVHYDESLNDAGKPSDWGYVSWFEDVDVDHR